MVRARDICAMNRLESRLKPAKFVFSRNFADRFLDSKQFYVVFFFCDEIRCKPKDVENMERFSESVDSWPTANG